MASPENQQGVGRASGASQRSASPDDFEDRIPPFHHQDHQLHHQDDLVEPRDHDEQDVDVELDRGLQRRNNAQRNRNLEGTHQSTDNFMATSVKYKLGQLVELSEPIGLFKIQFLEIKSIHVHNETGQITIRGFPYSRTRNLHQCLPCKLNEVCVVLEVDDDDERPIEEQALVEVHPEDIKKARVLINTNKSFPACRFDPVGYATKEQREEEGPLACRWTMSRHYKDSRQRKIGRCYGGALVHSTENDRGKIKKRNLGADNDRAHQWRGETILGGSDLEVPDVVEIDADVPGSDAIQTVQKYSFADFFCGAGGASRGAEMAGLKIVAAIESWMYACDTYHTNFPSVRLYEMDGQSFLEEIQHDHVDILHLSPPFKRYNVEDDEENNTTRTTCIELINKLKPRLFIMELPITMLSEQQTTLLNKLIQDLTSVGYSVQWKATSFVDYGLPQMRKRLMMIGAGPGEIQPSWPAVSHSSEPTGNQQPFMTEAEAISGLRSETTTLHNPQSLRPLNRLARDGDEPVGTLSSSAGAAVIHFSGRRDFTLRELACLQGFPETHHFQGTGIKKQIGSAFPPSVAKVFFHHLRRCLEEHDGIPLGAPRRQATPIAEQPALGNIRENHQNEEMNGDQDQDVVMADAFRSIELDAGRTIATIASPARHRTRPVSPPGTPVARRNYASRAIAAFTPSQSRTPAPEAETGKKLSAYARPAMSESLPIRGSRAAAIQKKRARGLDEESTDHDDGDRSLAASQERPRKRQRQYASGSRDVNATHRQSHLIPSSSSYGKHSSVEPSMHQSSAHQQGGWAHHLMVEAMARSF
ncbi:hypothetical protein diail_819 [Diaporthe ilicicola]|nr:hypothetical protein diail_819 [Diaporthe ilicicola]